MRRYDLLIFDFDGTLENSGEWVIATYNALAPDMGLQPIPRDQLEALRGKSTREIMATLGVPMWKLPQLAKRLRERASADAESIELFAGVDAMLSQLKQRGFTVLLWRDSDLGYALVSDLGDAELVRLGNKISAAAPQ